MKILVDADACPVKELIVSIAREYGIEVLFFLDTSHILDDGYSRVITVGQDKDAADISLINRTEEGDIVVTQDYGLAAMALSKKAMAIHPGGLVYSGDQMDRLLFERFLFQKIRRSGGRGPHGRRRTREDDERFARAFKELCLKALAMEQE